jgi:hypothetical protein
MRAGLLKALTCVLAVMTVWAVWVLTRYTLSIGTTQRHHVESALLILFAIWAARLAVLTPSNDGDRESSVTFEWLLFANSVVVALIVFWRALSIGFLSDDFVLADWARRGEFIHSSHMFVRPVPLVVWRLVFEAGGGAVALHAASVLLHGSNGALVAQLGRRLGLSSFAAVVAALLFVVWPTQVEAVAWAASFPDVLMTTLTLVALLMYGAPPPWTLGRALSIAIPVVVAFFVKETAVALVALLAIVAALRWRRQRPASAEIRTFVTVAALTAIYLYWRLALRPEVAGTIHPVVTRYVLKEQIARTFAGLATPVTADSSISPAWLALVFSVVLLLMIVWSVLFADRRRPAHEVAVAGGVWCLVSTAPTIGYLLIGAHLEGSRYLYLPMAGWAIAVAACWQASVARHRWMRPVGAAMLGVLIVLSIQQTSTLLSDWRDAAILRDTILQSAVEASRQANCGTTTFKGLPETYLAAQLFRNGFDEAFGQRYTPVTNGKACEFAWDGQRFK